MKLLVAIDSFKGSATSKELNEALLSALSDDDIVKISVPIADGGEGTIYALKEALDGTIVSERVPDLSGEPTDVPYLISQIQGEKIAFIESAKVIGIDRINPTEKTIQNTSSYGLGLLLRKVIELNVNKVYISLGGSGTSDGGLGFLAGLGALGISNTRQNPLLSFDKIDLTKIKELFTNIELIALADVTNCYSGEHGFSKCFGPQKGGAAKLLEKMDNLAKVVAKEFNQYADVDINDIPGSGAAGGLGGAVLAIGGHLKPGFQTISDFLNLEKKISEADLVITGEGKIDNQTENGKVPFGVATIAKKYNKPVFAICGTRSADIGEMSNLLLGAFSIHLGPISLSEAMNKELTLEHLKITGGNLVRLFREGGKEN